MIFSPIEPIFAPLINPLVELIDLPEIGFTISVSFEDSSAGNVALCEYVYVANHAMQTIQGDEPWTITTAAGELSL